MGRNANLRIARVTAAERSRMRDSQASRFSNGRGPEAVCSPEEVLTGAAGPVPRAAAGTATVAMAPSGNKLGWDADDPVLERYTIRAGDSLGSGADGCVLRGVLKLARGEMATCHALKVVSRSAYGLKGRTGGSCMHGTGTSPAYRAVVAGVSAVRSTCSARPRIRRGGYGLADVSEETCWAMPAADG